MGVFYGGQLHAADAPGALLNQLRCTTCIAIHAPSYVNASQTQRACTHNAHKHARVHTHSAQKHAHVYMHVLSSVRFMNYHTRMFPFVNMPHFRALTRARMHAFLETHGTPPLRPTSQEHKPDEVELPHPWEAGDRLGGRILPSVHGVFGGLPYQAPQGG